MSVTVFTEFACWLVRNCVVDDRCFPSGDAGIASTAATLAARNPAFIDMAPAARTGAAAGLEAIAIGTGWARVEARRHFAADVVAGDAIGHLFAAFAHHALVEGRLPSAEIGFYPMEDGAAVRLTLPLGPAGRAP